MAHDFKRFPELTNFQMDIYYWISPHRQITEGFTARVVRVKDGDTVQVTTDFRDFDFPVRLFQIDAPELKEGGLESKEWLRKRIEGEEVYIQIDPKHRVGKFGRLIGDIMFGGQSMSAESLNQGMSQPFSRSESLWD